RRVRCFLQMFQSFGQKGSRLGRVFLFGTRRLNRYSTERVVYASQFQVIGQRTQYSKSLLVISLLPADQTNIKRRLGVTLVRTARRFVVGLCLFLALLICVDDSFKGIDGFARSLLF